MAGAPKQFKDRFAEEEEISKDDTTGFGIKTGASTPQMKPSGVAAAAVVSTEKSSSSSSSSTAATGNTPSLLVFSYFFLLYGI
jgi:hypothetical protein